MRVVHVIDSLGGSGGAEHGLVREITRFSPSTDQLVVRLFSKDHLEARLRSAGIEVVPLGLRAQQAGWNWPLAVRRLMGVLRVAAPDVIHSSLFTANLVAQHAGARTSTPVLSTFTLSGEPGLLRRFQPGAASWRAALLRQIAARAARRRGVWFRALTYDAKETNARLLGVDPNRVTVLPRGIETDLLPRSPMTRRELDLPPDVPLLVNVGRQTAQKGHISLLTAFQQVRRKIDSHLVIIGREGDATHVIEQFLRSQDLRSSVTLVGYTPHVHHYLAHAKAFVFSSFMEGLGTAVLEAMEMGLPVVAYAIPPVREATDDGRVARLVTPGDEAALAEGIISTLLEPVHGEAARQWVHSRFAIDTIASRLESLLVEVARE